MAEVFTLGSFGLKPFSSDPRPEMPGVLPGLLQMPSRAAPRTPLPSPSSSRWSLRNLRRGGEVQHARPGALLRNLRRPVHVLFCLSVHPRRYERPLDHGDLRELDPASRRSPGIYLSLLASSSGSGRAEFYEIRPDGRLLSSSYTLYPGHNRLVFHADVVGRHVLPLRRRRPAEQRSHRRRRQRRLAAFAGAGPPDPGPSPGIRQGDLQLHLAQGLQRLRRRLLRRR